MSIALYMYGGPGMCICILQHPHFFLKHLNESEDMYTRSLLYIKHYLSQEEGQRKLGQIIQMMLIIQCLLSQRGNCDEAQIVLSQLIVVPPIVWIMGTQLVTQLIVLFTLVIKHFFVSNQSLNFYFNLGTLSTSVCYGGGSSGVGRAAAGIGAKCQFLFLLFIGYFGKEHF